MRFLSGAAEDGDGSAALPLTRRPDRLMSRRMTNLLAVAAAAAVLAMVAARIVFPSGAIGRGTVPLRVEGVSSTADSYGVTPVPIASVGTPTPAVTTAPSSRREYAVALSDLRGLPLDTAPGTPLELWVAWDEAYTDGPEIQKLVKSVTVARFLEPVTSEGPLVVVLSVPERSMRAVMYGDRFGSFSVTLPTTS